MEIPYFFPLPVIASVRVSTIRARTATIGRVRFSRASATTLITCTSTMAMCAGATAAFATTVAPSAPSQNKRSFSSVFDLFKAGLSRLFIKDPRSGSKFLQQNDNKKWNYQ